MNWKREAWMEGKSKAQWLFSPLHEFYLLPPPPQGFRDFFFYNWDFNYDPIMHTPHGFSRLYLRLTRSSPSSHPHVNPSLLFFLSLLLQFPLLQLFQLYSLLALTMEIKVGHLYTTPLPYFTKFLEVLTWIPFFFLFFFSFFEGRGGFVIWLSSIDQGSTTEVRELAHLKRSYKPPHY